MTRFYLEDDATQVTVVEEYEADEVFVGIQIKDFRDKVTFWGKGDIRETFRKALSLLDNYYEERDNAFARLHRGQGPDVV